MALTTYWPDKYIEKKCSAQEALRRIRPGQRVFIGSSCGEPQHLVRELRTIRSIQGYRNNPPDDAGNGSTDPDCQ